MNITISLWDDSLSVIKNCTSVSKLQTKGRSKTVVYKGEERKQQSEQRKGKTKLFPHAPLRSEQRNSSDLIRDTRTKKFLTVRELTWKKVSKLLAHLISDVFLRAGFQVLIKSTYRRTDRNPNCKELESPLRNFAIPSQSECPCHRGGRRVHSSGSATRSQPKETGCRKVTLLTLVQGNRMRWSLGTGPKTEIQVSFPALLKILPGMGRIT